MLYNKLHEEELMKNKNLYKKLLLKFPYGRRIWQTLRAISLLRVKSFRDLFFEVSKNDICLDLGANRGFACLVMWLKGVKFIYALEPNKEAYFALKNNLKGIKNISILNMAISSETKIDKLFLHNSIKEMSDLEKILDYAQSSSLIANKTGIGDCYYEVNCINFNDLFKKLRTKPNVIKCDIEGGEYIIYKQLIKLADSNHIRKMFIECHANRYPQFKKPHNDFIKLIKEKRLSKIIDTEWH